MSVTQNSFDLIGDKVGAEEQLELVYSGISPTAASQHVRPNSQSFAKCHRHDVVVNINRDTIVAHPRCERNPRYVGEKRHATSTEARSEVMHQRVLFALVRNKRERFVDEPPESIDTL